MARSRNLIILVVGIALLAGVAYFKDKSTVITSGNQEPGIVISLGEDLNTEQRKIVRGYFNSYQNGREARLITVSNAEERRYLQGVIDEKLIGTRAISSAYCELLDKGSGIEVQVENITAITSFMYANALSTAGISDARVIVAAPFKVSGTAALTGIIKAFESASGKNLNENAKQTAHQEIAETSELGREIGNDNAQKIIYEVKRKVIEDNISQPEEIKKIIIEVAANLNISLSEAQMASIISLMQKLNQLDIKISNIDEQLQNLERNIKEIKSSGEEAIGFIQKLINLLNSLIANIQSII
jgi:uncharacterized protein YpuA (DUF1002 family)